MKPSRDFLIGIIGIVGLVGLAAMLVLFGEIRFRQPQQYRVVFALDNAAGLSAGSPVSLNGVAIGRVERTSTALDPMEGVLLELSILDSVKIPRDVRVSISTSFVGDTRLSLRTRQRDALSESPGFLEKDEVLRASAGDLLDEIASLLDERISTFSNTAESIERMAQTFTRVGQRLDQVLSTLDSEDGEPVNLALSVARVDRLVNEALGWLGDDRLRMQVDGVAADAREALQAVSRTAKSWDEAAIALSAEVQSASESVDEATLAFLETSRQLNSVLIGLQDIAAEVNQGQGTVGLLLRNPDLYRSLNDASIRLERMLREAQLLIEKYRTEGIPITF